MIILIMQDMEISTDIVVRGTRICANEGLDGRYQRD